MTVNLAINGAAGRMGQRVIALAAREPDLVVVAALVRPGDPRVGQDAALVAGVAAGSGVLLGAEMPADARPDVAVDFSTADATAGFLAVCLERKVPLVLATTGVAPAVRALVDDAARAIPILLASNLSLGVAVVTRLVREAARALGLDADVEILETHHRKKRDAPGGTALSLARAVAEARGEPPTDVVFGRPLYGRIAEADRPRGEIAVHAQRLGDVVGEHTVTFGFGSERIEIAHRAHSRDVFAAGALRAARFLAKAAPGVYGAEDVLFSR